MHILTSKASNLLYQWIPKLCRNPIKIEYRRNQYYYREEFYIISQNHLLKSDTMSWGWAPSDISVWTLRLNCTVGLNYLAPKKRIRKRNKFFSDNLASLLMLMRNLLWIRDWLIKMLFSSSIAWNILVIF